MSAKSESIPKLIPSFTITYDANGGAEAPETQGKAKDTDILLSSTIPVRDGYVFLGWSENKSAEEAEYMAETYILKMLTRFFMRYGGRKLLL